MKDSNRLQQRIEAASSRIDRSTIEMLTLLEDEMAERDYETLEHVARTRTENFSADERW